MAPGSRKDSGAILWTSALTATLRFSSSLWLHSPQGCIGLEQWAVWISFFLFLEMPRSALPSGLFMIQRLSEPCRPPAPCNSHPTLSSQPISSLQPSSLLRYHCTSVQMKVGVYIYLDLLICFFSFLLFCLHLHSPAFFFIFVSLSLNPCFMFTLLSRPEAGLRCQPTNTFQATEVTKPPASAKTELLPREPGGISMRPCFVSIFSS